ncbi:UNVERIFIED_CONTAM: hypothetical protein Sangu_3075000 [Sesamum angustifolium]|uniref:RNase H type-1 domain-containing protein n=1 Tax=Sesamum angustifolium TaxID=2727405 RepID=A0AAW2K8D4_9LAMI
MHFYQWSRGPEYLWGTPPKLINGYFTWTDRPHFKAAVLVVVTSPHGEDLEFAARFSFKASNNDEEYEALLIGMKIAHGVGARHLVAYSDSQLVVKQVEGTYEAKEENMIQYPQQIVKLRTGFESFQLTQIPKEEKIKADCISKLVSSLEDCRTRHITI